MNTTTVALGFCAVYLTSMSGCAAPTNYAVRQTGGHGAKGEIRHSSATQEEALKYAKSVVLVKRQVQGEQIRSYVKEVWRFEPGDENPPPIGSEYGRPMPYDARMRFPECDAVVFKFGANSPGASRRTWTLTVNDKGQVLPFEKESFDRVWGPDEVGSTLVWKREGMTVDELRNQVKNTRSESKKPSYLSQPTAKLVAPPGASVAPTATVARR